MKRNKDDDDSIKKKMGRPPHPPNYKPPKYKLDEIDRILVKHLIQFPAISQSELGKIVGMTRAGVAFRMKRPAFTKAMNDQLMTTPFLLKSGQEIALRRLIQIIQSGDAKLAIEAAKILLYPLVSGRTLDGKDELVKQGIVFQSRIGASGAVMREKIDVPMPPPDLTTITIESEPR